MNYTQVIGIVAGIFTSSSLLPQLIKIIKEKKVEDLSMGMFIALMVGVALWIVYGIMKDDYPIIVTNVFSLILNIAVLVLRYRYKE